MPSREFWLRLQPTTGFGYLLWEARGGEQDAGLVTWRMECSRAVAISTPQVCVGSGDQSVKQKCAELLPRGGHWCVYQRPSSDKNKQKLPSWIFTDDKHEIHGVFWLGGVVLWTTCIGEESEDMLDWEVGCDFKEAGHEGPQLRR